MVFINPIVAKCHECKKVFREKDLFIYKRYDEFIHTRINDYLCFSCFAKLNGGKDNADNKRSARIRHQIE